MMEDSSTAVEVDAIHHRLSGEVTTTIQCRYGCYCCHKRFPNLEELANHAHLHPGHSEEFCLKCEQSVTVFFNYSQVGAVRLHSCKRSNLRHQNSDLCILSYYLTTKLELNTTAEDRETVSSSIFCMCQKSFARTQEGVFKYLRHSNRRLHTTLPNCNKCTLPEFQMNLDSAQISTHFCGKVGRPLLSSRCYELEINL